ncbi:YadA-like family protein [Lonepinella sp. MS14436]|uniref:YadA-like family protein n=1 Tax=Lonepinella sp. MS14436 TaxID=3003619 RepID=UPI0036DD9265
MNVHKSSTIAQATSGSGKNSPMMRATSSSVSKSNAKAKFFAYNLFTSALILMSGQSFAGTGIYVNDGTDASCSVTFDGGSGGDIYTGMYSLNSSLVTSANRIDSGFTMKAGAADFIKYYYPQNSCLTSDKETQTYRTLFYGDANYSGSKHLTLGGRLDVNSGIIGVGNRGTNGTSATNSIRMGTGSSLNDTNDKNNAITIGVNSSASAESAVALGNTTTASGESTVAIGTLANSASYRAVAVGHNAQATGSRSTALGTESVASVESAVAIGDTSNASAKSALALGTSSVASGTDSAALGSRANATATSALAVGSTANATARNATAVGGQAQASGETSVALGTAANASKGNTVAVGASSSAAGDNAIAVGVKTTATTNSAIAIGNLANATGETSSIAIGRQSVASGTSAIAQGYKSSATVANSVALGSNSVASTAAGAVGTDPLSVASTTDLASTTWKSTYAAVSVGNGSTATRQITSVAAGTQDTDAVNVAQLKAAGFKLATTASAGQAEDKTSATATGTADKNIQNGETLTVDAGKNIKVTQTGQNVSIATKDEVEFTSVTAAGTKLSSAGLTFVDSTGTQVANSPSITATGINAGNNKITNVANGTGANDAVNFSQLQASQAASKEDVKSTDKTVTVTKTQGTDNSNIFDLSVNVDGTSITKNSTTGALQVNTTTLTSTGGKVDTPANTNALATASDIANAINNSGFTAKANSDSGELITAGEEVNFINGENIAITRQGSNFTVATAKNVTFNSVSVGNVKVDGTTNKITGLEAGTANTDAVNVGQLNKEVAASKEAVTTSDSALKVTTSTNTTTGANIYDIAINSVALATDTNGKVTAPDAADEGKLVTAKDVASAINNAGFTLKTSANGGKKDTTSTTDELINAGEMIDLAAGKNLTVKQEADGKVTYSLADEITLNKVTTGNTVMDTNGITIAAPTGGTTTDVKLTNSGLDNGNNKITNVANGTGANDAVNFSQLQASKEEVKSDDKSVKITQSQNTTTGANIYDLSVAIDGTTVTKDASTGQLKANTVDFTIDTAGKVTANTSDNALATAGDIAKAINGSGFTAKANSDAGELITAGEEVNFVNGNNIEITRQGSNFTVATAKNVTFDNVTVGNVKVDGTTNKITGLEAGTDANDAVNVQQLTDELAIIDDAIAASQEEVTTSDSALTVTTSTNTTTGANIYDIAINSVALATDANGKVTAPTTADAGKLVTAENVASAINNAGFTLKTSANGGEKDAASTTDELINAGDAIEMIAGKNLVVTQGANGKVTYATKNDVNFTTVTTEDAAGNKTVTSGTGIVITPNTGNAVSLTSNGLNNGGNKITNVTAGTDPNDAVNISQLQTAQAASKEEVKSDDKSVTIKQSQNTTTNANIYDLSVNVDGTSITKDTTTGELKANTADFAVTNGSVKANSNTNALATAKDIAKAINSSGFTLKTSATADGEKTSGSDELINPGDVIDLVAGKNLTVKQEANGTVTYALADAITLNKVTTGDTVMDTNGITIAAPTGATTTAVKLTNTGLDNGGNKITNVAAGTDENDAVNVGQLTDELAIIDDAIAASQEEVTSDDKSVTIATTQNADGANVFDLSVNVDDTTITKDATTGQLKANTVNFTTDAKGSVTANTNPNSLATAGDIANAINSSGFTAKANGDSGELITAGEEVNFINGDNISITRSGSNFTVATTKDVTFNSVSVGNVKVDGTTNKITGLEAGTDANDAVNVQQLTDELAIIDDAIAASQEEVTTSDSALTVTTSTNATTGANIYDIAINSVALATDTNGKVTAPDAADEGKLVTAKDVASAINNAGFTLKTSANGGTKDATSTADELINAGDVIDLVAGKNLTVKQEANGTVTYALAKEIDLNKVTTGNTVMDTNGITIAAPTGATTTAVKLTNTGLDNGGNKITNVAAGTDENDAVNVGQLTDELAIIDDAIAASQEEVTSDDKSVTIATTQNADGANVFDLSVNVDDTTITKDATTGQLKANTVNFTTDAKGSVTANTNPNSLATAGDIANAINSSGFTAKANGDSGELITAGEEVNFINGDNIAITRSGSNFTVATAKDVKFDNVTVGNVKVDGTTNKITGLEAGTDANDAVNVQQLTDELAIIDDAIAASQEEVTTSDSALTVTTSTNATTGANIYDIAINSVALATDTNGKVTAPDAADEGKLVTAKDVASAINNAGFTLKTSANGGTKDATSTADELINAGDVIDLVAGKNLTVKQEANGTVTYATKNDVNFTTVTTEDAAGNKTVTSGTGIVITPNTGNAVSLTGNGLDNGGNKITNVAAGTDENDAVNVGQLTDELAIIDDAIAASQEEVTSDDKSVTIATTQNADGANVFDLSVNVDDTTITKDATTGQLKANTVNFTTDAKGSVTANTNPNSLATAGDIANAINSSGFTAKANGDSGELITAGEEVNFINGDNIAITRSGSNFTVATTKDVTFNSVSVGNVKVDGTTNKITGLEAGTDANDAVNVQQLTDELAIIDDAIAASQEEVTTSDSALTVTTSTNATTGANIYDIAINSVALATDSNGKVTAPTTADAGKLVTAENVASAINNAGFTLKTSANGGTKDATSTADELINAGDVIDLVAGKNLTVKQEANGTVTYALADAITLNKVTTGDTVMDTNGITIAAPTGATTTAVKLTNTGLDNGGNKITNVANGTDANDAVNVSQLQTAQAASKEEVKSDDKSVKITQSQNATTGANIYDLSVNVDGTSITKDDSTGELKANTADFAVTNGSVKANSNTNALATASDIAKAINSSGFTLKTSATADGEKTSGSDELINPGDVIDLVAGKNLTVKQEANGTVTYATKNDVNFTTVTTEDAAGNKTVTSGTGIVITPNTGNAVSLTGNGLDNGGNKITNVAAGTDENDAVNVGQLTDELAIIDDAIAASQEEVTSNDKSVTIATTQNADGANVFDLSVNVDDTTITKDATTGQLKANTVNFTTDAKGSVTANTNPNSLATAGDIANAINSSGFTAKANGDSGELITAGEEVNFINGDNISITRSGSNFTVATTKDVTFNSVSVGNVKVDGTTNKITGLTAGTADTDAVNVGQLNKEVVASKEKVTTSDSALKVTTSTNATTGANIYDIAINSVALATDANGKVTAPTTADAGKLVTAENVASAINNAGFTLKTSANGGEKISGDDEIINAGDEINLAAGKNLTVQQNTQGQVIFSTAENVEFTTVTAGGTRISSAGLTFVDPFTGVQKGYSPSITATGINAGGTKITNVEAGVDDTDAVNVGQLSDAIALLDESIAASQEEVKSTDNSVKVTTTKNTDQANVFDLSVNVDEKSITKDSTGALQVKTTNLTTTTDGKVDTPTDTDALATAANVANAINQSGFTLKTSATADGKKTSGSDELINPGDVIDLVAGKNLTVKQEADGKVTYSLADEIDLNKVTTGNTVMDTNGITITAPAGGSTTDVKLTNTGLDNGGNKITNVAAGTSANDAVNFSQLQASQAASKEDVKSTDKTVTVAKSQDTDGSNIFDLSVNVDDKTITKDSTGALQVNTTNLTTKADGKVATPTDTNALATAANVADAINKSGFTLKTSANGGTKVSGSDEVINPADTIDMAAGKNLTVTQEADGKITYATADKVGFEQITLGDATNNTVLTSTAKGLDVGGDKITNVANGDISPTSTDAINGSQLSNTTNSITDALGGGSTVKADGTITAPTYTLVSGNPAQNSTKAYYSVGNALNALNTAVNAPLTFAADSGNNVERQLGSTLNINGDAKNITTTTTSNGVTVALNDNISVKSVSVENGPTINSSGIQMANQQITGLKSGLDGTTIEQVAAQGASSPTWNNAATVGDLAQVQNNVVNSNNRINQLNDKINNVDKKLRAGVAGALATSGLPQAYIPGKSMVAIAAGSFKGENALAVGATRISDNGKVVLKLTGNTNTRGDVGTSVGLGYQW